MKMEEYMESALSSKTIPQKYSAWVSVERFYIYKVYIYFVFITTNSLRIVFKAS